ncbi:MAG: hypothetical protein AAF902_21865 [Chloroflexota bacterium]
MLNLPKDLISFLEANKQFKYNPLDCECGQVELLSYGELEEDVIWIDNSSANQKSYYELPVISLLADCDHYDPEDILVWLIDEEIFGTWDNEHWVLTVFGKTTWADIVKEPAKFLSAQWKEIEHDWAQHWKPKPEHEAINGWPL